MKFDFDKVPDWAIQVGFSYAVALVFFVIIGLISAVGFSISYYVFGHFYYFPIAFSIAVMITILVAPIVVAIYGLVKAVRG
jgi:hypothetical protein